MCFLLDSFILTVCIKYGFRRWTLTKIMMASLQLFSLPFFLIRNLLQILACNSNILVTILLLFCPLVLDQHALGSLHIKVIGLDHNA